VKDKQCNIKGKKEPRFPTPRKKEIVEWLVRDISAKYPELTLGQIRRVFSYGYRTLYGKHAKAMFCKIMGEE